ncbi:acyl-CoA dehydrogenase family protein [Salisediminibacterium beveridgei]|uniref:Acyl-CoA dehydrogenase n=1 Tax=Salisediminibacterium beveridgei TaxID=632773 RepID=A0A1D7QXT1_9BACI|nr:acyl-CoA dehydrogenase family protein [Salisediminibacterium beveridgei]AOM83815.1 Acyl-CoA dehydrogenase [Salisediminibacterium beveridgei]
MNFFEQDALLQQLLEDRLNPAFFRFATKELSELGRACAEEIDERAAHTDRAGEPQLLKYDKYGNEVSEVWTNEGYRDTVKQVYNMGIAAYRHKTIPELNREGNYLYSYAQGYLVSQSEIGFYCPVTLTMATAYLLDRYGSERLKENYLPHVLATGETELYEGATFLTERQGGSDVGAIDTYALHVATPDKKTGESHYRLYGEKYFASNAGMAEVMMVLARTPGAPSGTKGLSLFLVPLHHEGEKNRLSIRRLKDKLGVRAVPSAEVEFDGACGYLVGEKERGIYYMMEALNLSRVCNTVASLGIMKRAWHESYYYALERDAFGQRLMEFPMIQDSLVQMKVKHDAEFIATFDLIERFDRWYEGQANDKDEALMRLLIALLKSESADQSIHFAHEGIEMHGGNGYIEDFVTPRLLRDAQVLTVWEGTRNILGLEVIRLVRKYAIHDEFLRLCTAKMAEIPEDMTQRIHLHDAAELLKTQFDQFTQLPESEQTRQVHALTKKMVTLLEAVSLATFAVSHQEEKRWLDELDVYIQDQLNPLFELKVSGWSQETAQNLL